MSPDPGQRLVELLVARGETIGTAESLTAGLVSARIADVPGASRALRGGIVAYAVPLKVSLLGVPAALVEEHGVVSEPVALAMARGARERLGCDWAVATTGVAGPGPSEGVAAGTVCVAVSGPPRRVGNWAVARTLHLPGDREAVRRATTEMLVAWTAQRLAWAL